MGLVAFLLHVFKTAHACLAFKFKRLKSAYRTNTGSVFVLIILIRCNGLQCIVIIQELYGSALYSR